MKRPLVAALGIWASVDGFVTSGSTSCAATAADRTKVAPEILGREDAWRWAAANVVAPAILASTVLLGDVNMAYASDGAKLATTSSSSASPTENYLPRRLYPGTAADGANLATTSSSSSASPTENYLPRRLYPGSYQNYCGPTPEVQVKGGCVAHGWYGDAPADQVDAACQQHDVSYCNCETKFLSRRRMKNILPAQEIIQQQSIIGNDDDEEPIPLLASMVALRFATKPALQAVPTIQADAEYFDCVHRADQELIATGVRIRGEQQRAGCSTDPNLAWFCDLSGKGTLAAFEKINLNIFLKDLDNDEDRPVRDIDASRWAVFRTKPSDKKSSARESLAQIEHRREDDILRRLQSGISVSEAASSPDVMADEERLLSKLTTY